MRTTCPADFSQFLNAILQKKKRLATLFRRNAKKKRISREDAAPQRFFSETPIRGIAGSDTLVASDVQSPFLKPRIDANEREFPQKKSAIIRGICGKKKLSREREREKRASSPLPENPLSEHSLKSPAKPPSAQRFF